MKMQMRRFLTTAATAAVLLAVPGTALAATGGSASAAAPPAVHLVTSVRPAAVSQTAALTTLAVEANGTRLLLSPSGGLIVTRPDATVIPNGFTCIRVYWWLPTCGYELSKTQTAYLAKAVIAGGIAALGAACHRLGIPAEVCGAVASAAGTVVGVLIGQWKPNKCLYISLAPPGYIRMINC